MEFDAAELIRNITEYQNMDKLALFEIVKDHDPFDELGNYDYDIGLDNMSLIGLCTFDGSELKGGMESFRATLGLISRIKSDSV